MPPENEGQNQEGQERSPLSDAKNQGGEGQQGKDSKPVRPEGLADDYWNDDKGVDFAKLLGSHKTLSEFKAAQDVAAAARPQKVEDYKLELPEGFKAPDGVELTLDENDPRLAPARDLALKHGLSQEVFSELLALDAQSKIAEQKSYDEKFHEELKKLGTRGKVRVDGVTGWLTAKLGTEAANALVPMILTAKHVEAWEKLITLTKGSVPDFQGGRRAEDEDATPKEVIEKMGLTDRLVFAREENRKKASSKAA